MDMAGRQSSNATPSPRSCVAASHRRNLAVPCLAGRRRDDGARRLGLARRRHGAQPGRVRDDDRLLPGDPARRCRPDGPRVPWNDTIWIQRTLDAGALGLVVPMVNTPDDARAVVANMRYATRGQRSWGSSRVAPYLAGEYRDWADENLAIIVMIETIGAVRRAEEILAVDGVTGCFVGPNDLALSMGLAMTDVGPGTPHEAAMMEVLAASRNTGKAAGKHCADAEGSDPTDRGGLPVPGGGQRQPVHGCRGTRRIRGHQAIATRLRPTRPACRRQKRWRRRRGSSIDGAGSRPFGAAGAAGPCECQSVRPRVWTQVVLAPGPMERLSSIADVVLDSTPAHDALPGADVAIVGPAYVEDAVPGSCRARPADGRPPWDRIRPGQRGCLLRPWAS